MATNPPKTGCSSNCVFGKKNKMGNNSLAFFKMCFKRSQTVPNIQTSIHTATTQRSASTNCGHLQAQFDDRKNELVSSVVKLDCTSKVPVTKEAISKDEEGKHSFDDSTYEQDLHSVNATSKERDLASEIENLKRRLKEYEMSKLSAPRDGKMHISENSNVPSSLAAKCPFHHGTVYAQPCPGYVHGNPKKGICPNGCRPEMSCDITNNESSNETLIREAKEFIELYYHERKDEMKDTPGFETKEDRLASIINSIESSGTYEHTFDELQHGARVAWRNAPKCSNRKFWQQLKLLDCRDVDTNKGIFDCCLRHLAKAVACGASEAYISIFKPEKPGTSNGPRIWNDQLLQYACYDSEDGEGVIGDPKNLKFTQMLKERFGWYGPPDGKRGSYDYLPLVIQANINDPPELFELPVECAPPVYIHHPQYPKLSSLDMKWYPVPAVCALDLSLGGIVYTAVPFNGWYADTEVLRDLTDECRYNMLEKVSKCLNLDKNMRPGEAPLWKDEAMLVLTKAINHSYKSAKVTMVDHHNLIDLFWNWYRDEMLNRKYCPVNWKWVIPPMSSSTNRAYLGLNEAKEYTLKPAYVYGKGFVQLEKSYFGERKTQKKSQLMSPVRVVEKQTSVILTKRQQILIIYASVTGNSSKYASELGNYLHGCFNIKLFDACGSNAAAADEDVFQSIGEASLVIFVVSSEGNGEIPSLSRKFFSSLFKRNGSILFEKGCATLGFGSSEYPLFCGGAAYISEKLAENGATEIIPRGECDAMRGEAQTFHNWITTLVEKLAKQGQANPLVLDLYETLKSEEQASLLEESKLLDSIQVDVFSKEEVKNAAVELFLTRINSFSNPESSKEKMDRRTLQRHKSMRDIFARAHDSPTAHLCHEKGFLSGKVSSRNDLVNPSLSIGHDNLTDRKISHITIDLSSCGNPPYEPGDHVRILPHNMITSKKLDFFVNNLSGNLKLDHHIFVSFKHDDIPKSKIEMLSPLLQKMLGSSAPLKHIFDTEAAIDGPMSMKACQNLSQFTLDDDEKNLLQKIGSSESKHKEMIRFCGLKWIDLFDKFPSLSKQVTIDFLLHNMDKNYPRSYSISSCKAIVGAEMHIIVGRFIYFSGNNKTHVGVCSNYLTSILPGDEVKFQIESVRSFHHPLDLSSPIIFICAGTGFAPMRGLLQKRAYFQSRGENLGPSFLIFGSRCSKEGLFQDEINEFQEKGVLTDVFLCYSREPGMPKEYITDKLRTNAVRNILNPLLVESNNTHIFICGSLNMTESCKNALRDISCPFSVDTIEADQRLHCDAFGAALS